MLFSENIISVLMWWKLYWNTHSCLAKWGILDFYCFYTSSYKYCNLTLTHTLNLNRKPSQLLQLKKLTNTYFIFISFLQMRIYSKEGFLQPKLAEKINK